MYVYYYLCKMISTIQEPLEPGAWRPRHLLAGITSGLRRGYVGVTRRARPGRRPRVYYPGEVLLINNYKSNFLLLFYGFSYFYKEK